MNTKPTISSFIVRAALLLLTVFTTTGAWAQTPITVETEEQLTDAIADGATIQLAKDIQLSNYLNINGITVTIDLNGHTLSRNLSEHNSGGHVIYANGGCNLTLTSTAEGYGIIEGGKANNGGAINITHDNTVTATNVTFQNNSAAQHAGAIWNNGTFTATDCTFENNTANDVGAIYNAVQTVGSDTYAGTAILTNCTFTGNVGTTGAGALANALGATNMTIEGCTIQNNTAGSRGGGIWNGGNLHVKGVVKVTDNTNVDGLPSNVFMKDDKLMYLYGNITGSRIGIELERLPGKFTSGYNNRIYTESYTVMFFPDIPSHRIWTAVTDSELRMEDTDIVHYAERSWDATNKKVVSTLKGLTGSEIGYDATPAEGQYKEVTNPPAEKPDEWFGMGGYSDKVAEYYVVRENVNRETIVVQGNDVHLILCDGAELTLTGGLKLEGDNKLYIHSQSYGGNMGKLMVTNSYDYAAGIGSAWDNGNVKEVGELVIYGGHIEATGGDYGAGIGSCGANEKNDKRLCNKVTVYGGFVEAHGGKEAAGIGGGVRIHGGDFILYDGIVIARGRGTGIGSGFRCDSGGNVIVYNGSLTASDVNGAGIGGTVTISGGTVTATGGKNAAGIGGANLGNGEGVTISGGTVTATGGENAAGIGGGFGGNGGDVTITGGTVTAIGGVYGAGIGGGWHNDGGNVTITGGMVSAIGALYGAGIGGGWEGKGGNVTITGGTVIAKTKKQGEEGNRAIGPGRDNNNYGTLTIGNVMMVGAGNNGSVERIYDADERVNACWYRTYAEISPCTHPSGITYTINEDDTHTSHCKHCALSEKTGHFDSDDNGTCVCGYKDGEEYHTITIATSSNGIGYEGVGEKVKVGKDKPYTLPVCSIIPDGYDFAGWVVSPQSQDNGILPNEGETLLQAGENITITGNVSIFARYRTLEISLADGSNNSETLYTYNGRKAASVTLTGRTLYKDGKWNTLCLPFNLTLSGSVLDGDYVKLKTLNDASFSNGTLTLNFEDATEIEAGKPYIIKWNGGNNITNPEFAGVTISNASPDDKAITINDVVSFVGNYSPYNITGENKKLLYLGSDDKLYYPDASMIINAFRAYFELQGDLICGPSSSTGGINNFVLNFGGETGIENIRSSILNLQSEGWFTIDGMKLNGKPKAKGIYINNGRKVVIK